MTKGLLTWERAHIIMPVEIDGDMLKINPHMPQFKPAWLGIDFSIIFSNTKRFSTLVQWPSSVVDESKVVW